MCETFCDFFSGRFKEYNNMDIDRFLAIEVSLGEPMTLAMESLIMNQILLFVFASSPRLKDSNTNLVDSRTGKVTKALCSIYHPVTITLVTEYAA